MAVDQVKRLYESMPSKLDAARRRFGRPLTLAEKILVAHADDFAKQEWSRGKPSSACASTACRCRTPPGRWRCSSSCRRASRRWRCRRRCTATTSSGRRPAPRTDMKRAITENSEVYDFLHSASKKYGIGFWKPGAGIIHQVVLENYAFPGGLMIGADSHTPNAGGLGMIAIGVGGADCGEAMAGLAWEVLDPKLIGVRLTGKLSGWTSAKDVITYLLGLLTVKGGTNKIVEYFGPGARLDQRHRQGHHLQHGRGARGDDLAVPLRRPDGRVSPGHRSRRHRRAGRGQPRAPGGRSRGAGRSREVLRRGGGRSTSPSSSRTSWARIRPTARARSASSPPR